MPRRFVRPDPRDLELLGLPAEVFTRRLLTWTIGGGFVTSIAGVAGVALGVLSSVPLILVATSVASVGSGAWWTTTIRRRAEQARADADLVVSVYLDLVTILLAGGAGLETALVSAASCGDGRAFGEIRTALARAQSARRNYWDELRDWGRRTGVESIVEVAHSVQIAGEHGARIRASLVAKSKSLRSRNVARVEHDAGRRTEQMGLPIVAMFVGFVVFVSYPALMGTIGQF